MQSNSMADLPCSVLPQDLYHTLPQAVSFSLVSQDSKDKLFKLIKDKQMTPEAERFNGWAAMLGFVAAVGAYATTGQLIPGIF